MSLKSFHRSLLVTLFICALLGIGGGAAIARTTQLLPPSGKGNVRAVVVGIDRYVNVKNLLGAVADARDIEKTLRSAGVIDIAVLIDETATRRNFENAMNRIVEVSQSGDLVIVSFAGHGAQTPERVKGSEVDGMDEIFLLSAFSEKGPGTTERVLDDELNAWISRLDKKEVHVLLIADTCHGGGLLRKPDLRAGEISYRWAGTVSLIDDGLKPVSTDLDARLKIGDMPNVTFLAAVDKFSKAPEVSIPGNKTKRGALSYAVARTVDRGKNGSVTREQLFKSARQLTYQYSQTQQSIATEPAGQLAQLDRPVFMLEVTGRDDKFEIADAVRIKLRNVSESSLSALPTGQFKLKIVPDNEDADLIWDASKGEVLSQLGDLVAKCSRPDDISAIVDRTGSIAALAKLSEAGTQDIKLLPNDKRFHKDDVVKFKIDNVANKFLILINISGDGTVRFLFPSRVTDVPLIQSSSFELPLKVGEPYGSDNVVAVVSDERLLQLESELGKLDGQKVAGVLPSIIAQYLIPDRNSRLGLAALFTVQ